MCFALCSFVQDSEPCQVVDNLYIGSLYAAFNKVYFCRARKKVVVITVVVLVVLEVVVVLVIDVVVGVVVMCEWCFHRVRYWIGE